MDGCDAFRAVYSRRGSVGYRPDGLFLTVTAAASSSNHAVDRLHGTLGDMLLFLLSKRSSKSSPSSTTSPSTLRFRRPWSCPPLPPTALVLPTRASVCFMKLLFLFDHGLCSLCERATCRAWSDRSMPVWFAPECEWRDAEGFLSCSRRWRASAACFDFNKVTVREGQVAFLAPLEPKLRQACAMGRRDRQRGDALQRRLIEVTVCWFRPGRVTCSWN